MQVSIDAANLGLARLDPISSLHPFQLNSHHGPGTRKTGFWGGITDPFPLCAELSGAGQVLFTVKVEDVAAVIGKAPLLALFFIPVTYTVIPRCSNGPLNSE